MMRMFARLGTGSLAALAAVAVHAAPAAAWFEWCDGDPPLMVTTPAGNHVNVNNFVLTGSPDPSLRSGITVTGYGEAAGPGHTLIHVIVHVPAGEGGNVEVVSSSGRFQVQANGSGEKGDDIAVELTVPVS